MPTVERRLPGRVKPESEVVMKPSQAGTEVHVTGDSNANVTTKRTQHGVEKVWEHMASKGKSNCDLEIRCEDGIIFSHQAVLGLASKMVRDLICRQSQLEVSLGGWPGGAVVPVICDRRKEEHVVIVVPDISRGVMSKLLNLLYSGNIPIQDTEEAAKVKEAWKVLEIDVVNLKKLIFEKVDVPAIKKEAVSPEGFRIKKDPSEIAPFRMSRHAHGGDDEDPDDPDPLGDFSDQASRRNSVGASGTKRRPGPASRTVIDKAPLKKMKIENGNQKYKVEQIHNCVICNGKTADGKVDKDAINLSFRQVSTMSDAKDEVESQGSQEAQEDFKSEFLASGWRLSPEITLKVLESVGPTDLGQVSQTCSLMRTWAEDEKLWTGKCAEEGFKKEILNSKDLQILADRRSKEKSFKPSRSKANYSKHFTRELYLTRKPIREPTVIDASGGSEISRVLELTHNKVIYVCGNTVKVWSALTGEHLYTLAGHTRMVLTVQMNEEFIITGSMDSTLKVWSSTTGACLRTLRGHTGEVWSSHLREDILVSGSWDKTVRLWDVREGTCINTLEGHEDWVRCVQFNGTVVASADAHNVIKIWDQERANCLHTLRGHFGFSSSHNGPVVEIKFYGDLLVSASWDKTVKVWNINTGGVALHTIPADSLLWWVSGYGGLIAMDENILVTVDAKALNKQTNMHTGHQDNTAKMWDIFTGRHLLTFAGPHKHTREITGVRIESKFVVTASDDGSIKLWNLLQLEEGGKVLAMKMEDAKIVALTQKASDKKEIIVLNFDIEY